MSEDRRLSAADQGSVDRARQALEETQATEFSTGETIDMLVAIDDLQRHVGALLQVVDRLTPTRSERLAAQADVEFLNLARAVRVEISTAQGSLRRLDSFQQALVDLLYPEGEAGR